MAKKELQPEGSKKRGFFDRLLHPNNETSGKAIAPEVEASPVAVTETKPKASTGGTKKKETSTIPASTAKKSPATKKAEPKAAEKVTMTPAQVAKLAVDGMFAKKQEVITGFINKLGAFLAWVAPKAISEKVAKGIYE